MLAYLTYIPGALAVAFIVIACVLKPTPPRTDKYRKDDDR